jgi:hypothetical protein
VVFGCCLWFGVIFDVGAKRDEELSVADVSTDQIEQNQDVGQDSY